MLWNGNSLPSPPSQLLPPHPTTKRSLLTGWSVTNHYHTGSVAKIAVLLLNLFGKLLKLKWSAARRGV